MKSSRLAAATLCLLALFLSVGAVRAADPSRFQALLIWGTDDEQSPDPKHKPVDAALAEQLRKSPYRWKHYFEVNRVSVEIPVNLTKKNISMSSLCKLDIKNFGSNWVEVKLLRQGQAGFHKQGAVAAGARRLRRKQHGLDGRHPRGGAQTGRKKVTAAGLTIW